jgi:hypothetical protein
MSIRWTKRPQNYYRFCGYSWYPRGKNVSACCPRCGSREVELVLEGCLRAVGYVLAAPLVLIAIVIRLLAAAFLAIAKWVGVSTAPARGAVLSGLSGVVKGFCSGVAFGVRWTASVKDDLLSEGDREVNPVGLIAKLLVIVAVSIVSIILVIKTLSGLALLG